MYIVEVMMIKLILTFYCDADQYLPIRFFEAWMNFIAGTSTSENVAGGAEKYFYRVKFPVRVSKWKFRNHKV